MTILRDVWRFQCDPRGLSDPEVEVFLQSVTVVEGKTFTDQIMTPVKMKLSTLIAAATMPGITAKAIEIADAAAAAVTAANAAAEIAADGKPQRPAAPLGARR